MAADLMTSAREGSTSLRPGDISGALEEMRRAGVILARAADLYL
jgi:hypothetical protein